MNQRQLERYGMVKGEVIVEKLKFWGTVYDSAGWLYFGGITATMLLEGLLAFALGHNLHGVLWLAGSLINAVPPFFFWNKGAEIKLEAKYGDHEQMKT